MWRFTQTIVESYHGVQVQGVSFDTNFQNFSTKWNTLYLFCVYVCVCWQEILQAVSSVWEKVFLYHLKNLKSKIFFLFFPNMINSLIWISKVGILIFYTAKVRRSKDHWKISLKWKIFAFSIFPMIEKLSSLCHFVIFTLQVYLNLKQWKFKLACLLCLQYNC